LDVLKSRHREDLLVQACLEGKTPPWDLHWCCSGIAPAVMRYLSLRYRITAGLPPK